jgi:hypothetical protein
LAVPVLLLLRVLLRHALAARGLLLSVQNYPVPFLIFFSLPAERVQRPGEVSSPAI